MQGPPTDKDTDVRPTGTRQIKTVYDERSPNEGCAKMEAIRRAANNWRRLGD